MNPPMPTSIHGMPPPIGTVTASLKVTCTSIVSPGVQCRLPESLAKSPTAVTQGATENCSSTTPALVVDQGRAVGRDPVRLHPRLPRAVVRRHHRVTEGQRVRARAPGIRRRAPRPVEQHGERRLTARYRHRRVEPQHGLDRLAAVPGAVSARTRGHRRALHPGHADHPLRHRIGECGAPPRC